MERISVSTPSRLCLFGEHQDYLGLEVIAQAINIRFYAEITKREDSLVKIKIESKNFYDKNEVIFKEVYHEVDLSKEIIYENNRDYIKSTLNMLKKKGYINEKGFNIKMTSEIPIGKGMCSSSTMIVVLIKAILEAVNSKDKDNAKKIAYLAYVAEVEEFNEPGGMMDHFASSLGNLINLNFLKEGIEVYEIENNISGEFVLFDSLKDKDTTRVLGNSKYPVVRGLEKLKIYGVNSIKDFINNEETLKLLEKLTEEEKVKIEANIENYKILQESKKLFSEKVFNEELFGELLNKHHKNLRDGLNISTPEIEEILERAKRSGALGGKINGSGGGGCCFVYAKEFTGEKILKEVEKLGYKGRVVRVDSGVRREK